MKFSQLATELVVFFKLAPKLIANFNKLQELLTIKHFFLFPGVSYKTNVLHRYHKTPYIEICYY